MLRRCDFLRDIPRRLWFERRAWENPFRYFGVRRHVSSKSSINLPECRCANLISRFMKLMLGRLSEDWQARWGHPGVMVETFVDSQFFQGTAYKASGWSMLGATAGFARTGQGKDYYVAHGRPKQLWVRELCKGAAKKLCAPALAEAWAAVEKTVAPRCRASAAEIRSLSGLLSDLPAFRRRQSLGYPLPGMLALIAMALICGVVRGQRDLAAFARTLSQGQLRALKFRSNNRTGRVRCPDETTFFRVLDGVDEQLLEHALLAWQQQILGPVRDTVIALDGKKRRHAQGVELVSAIGVQSGRWLGTVRTASKSNEIPAARELLTKLDLVGKTLVADALHTQVETAQQIVPRLRDGGGDYVFTVKDNQKTLNQTIATLLEKRGVSPCTHTADASLQAGA
jgi:predicted transposase YbfD/YdcC